MANYYKYVFNWSNSFYGSNINWQCIFINSLNHTSCHWTCKDVVSILPWWNDSYISYVNWTEAYCTQKQTYYDFSTNSSYKWEYSLWDTSNLCKYWDYSNWSSCVEPGNLKISKVYVTKDQTTSMWTSLVQAWSWLVHIWIQLMPYAIWFTVIMLLFALFKNWWRLKADWQLRRIHRNKTRKERAEIIWKTHYNNFRNWPTIYKD